MHVFLKFPSITLSVGVIVNIIKPILSRSVFLICYYVCDLKLEYEGNQTIPN